MITDHQARLGNDWERAVYAKDEFIDPATWPREVARYRWAASHLKPGMRVLEIGCSSGWGLKFFPEDIDYTGVDAAKDVVDFARDQFGGPRRTFIWSTLNAFLDTLGDQTFDAVIAMEVLEHIPNGKEAAQWLKQVAPLVILTAPYREPVGFWGPHHKLHNLREADFPQFSYAFLHGLDTIDTRPTSEPNNLMLMAWQQGEVYEDRKRTLCSIPTRERYDILMNCLQAVAAQTVPVDKVVIYDDTPESRRLDLRGHPIAKYLFSLFTAKGIEWEVVFTPGLGQHIAHQMANESGYDFVWRLDDDCIPEPDVHARLRTYLLRDPQCGAAGGAVYETDKLVPGTVTTMRKFFSGATTQWAPDHGVFEVEFIYSSFLYRAGIVDYKHTMSPAAFHEETIFTHRLFRAGYKLIVDTHIHTYHFKAPAGGTRHMDLKWGYAWDQAEFIKILEQEFGIKLIEIGVGLGDNYAFLQVLPDIIAKHPVVIIATCYPEVYEEFTNQIEVVPFQMAGTVVNNSNIYDWMSERHWTGSLADAFRQVYAT